jgi:hypothetical protein
MVTLRLDGNVPGTSGKPRAVAGNGDVHSGEEVVVSGNGDADSGKEVIVSGKEVIVSGNGDVHSGKGVVLSGKVCGNNGNTTPFSGKRVHARGNGDAYSGNVDVGAFARVVPGGSFHILSGSAEVIVGNARRVLGNGGGNDGNGVVDIGNLVCHYTASLAHLGKVELTVVAIEVSRAAKVNVDLAGVVDSGKVDETSAAIRPEIAYGDATRSARAVFSGKADGPHLATEADSVAIRAG